MNSHVKSEYDTYKLGFFFYTKLDKLEIITYSEDQ